MTFIGELIILVNKFHALAKGHIFFVGVLLTGFVLVVCERERLLESDFFRYFFVWEENVGFSPKLRYLPHSQSLKK